jgi:serine protease Do
MNNSVNIKLLRRSATILSIAILSNFFPISFNILADEAEDKEWDKVQIIGLEPGVRYKISSGTGFFISEDKIITSEHVVEKCINIAIRGAKIKPATAKLITSDSYEDLALLETDARPIRFPSFRTNISEIKKGDKIYSIGYPLNRGETGLYLSKQAEVIRYFVRQGRKNHEIEFTDSVDHGNSGGPILDENYNIIGVVKAKVTYQNTKTKEKSVVGVGVGLDGVFTFLDSYGIKYNKSNSFDLVKSFRPDLDAKEYIVNIHCARKN